MVASKEKAYMEKHIATGQRATSNSRTIPFE
jgi:hypothetical protein